MSEHVGGLVYLSRKEHFSAAHRLHSDNFSLEENAKIYGKCNHVNGHGHNYTVEVILRGPVDSGTGMVYDLNRLKLIIQEVMLLVDHRNLDKDVDYFRTRPSTAENIAIYIWQELKTRLDRPDLLFEVRLNETEKNCVFFRGEN